MQLANKIKNRIANKPVGRNLKWLRPLKWVFAAFLIFALSKIGVEYKHKQTIQNLIIKIDGADSQNGLLKEDVLAQIEESFGFDLTGSKIQLLDLENIEKVVEQYDYVKSTDVYIDAENNIHVDILQRTPLVRVFDKSGAHYYMDDAGFKIEADGDIRARVLVVNGIIGPYERDAEGYLLGGLHDVFLLASKINADPFMKSLIEQVYVKNNYEMVLFPKIGKEHIQFGRAEDIEVKFKRLKNFYEGGIRYKGWNKYKEINLRYKDQVITKESA